MKGVANHASKEYEFSHLLSYSGLVQSQLPFERGGKTIIPTPFTYDNISISVSNLESEAECPVESIYEIEDEVHSDPNPNPVPTPNPRPKWADKFIEVAGNMTGDPSDMRRTRYQFQKESLALCQANSLPSERCNKLRDRCYMMVRNDKYFCSLNNKLDHVTLPLE